ncbi:Tripartite motif-containing protein 3 [Geodia barretti]|uniref:Tripartite motif-containing protein 3 n=1 Tax=Geodia barretti TaxID=519541 RepID=A0AA35R2N4_GEOBA|nr:Tripartite motif-containing protein 3 [Geodia barretti]
MDEYQRPRVLPCLHVFCEACLEKLVGTQLSAPCPNCRKPVRLPEGGVSSLPSAFYIQHLIEVREVLEKVRDPEKMQCDKCGEGEVQGFCQDCGQFICQPCLDVHSRWREFKTHDISDIDEVKETALKLVTLKKCSMLCPRHPAERIRIYCETCDELLCHDCALKTHRDHNYDHIQDVFPKHRDAILACLGPVKSELASVGSTIAGLKARSSRLDGQGLKAKAKVDAAVDKLQAFLEARRRELHSQIDGKVCQGKKELAARLDGHELRQAQLRSCVEFVEGSLQSGTQEEVLSMKRQVEERARELADELRHQKLELGPEKAICVVCADLSSAFEKLGQVQLASKFEGTHLKTISGVNRPSHTAFATSGEIVVCEWNANRVSVFGRDHTHLRSFGRKGSKESRLEEPLGVAISPDNTVFVAACHCVQKFTLDGELIASVGSEGSGPLHFHTPFAIAHSETNSRVYVCDTVNNRVTILNSDLSLYGSFGSKGREAGEFNMPQGIAVDRKGNVLVADHLNNRVQIFDASGCYHSSIAHTEPDQKLQGPISVAVGPDDWVYVVENYSNRVSLFDECYKYIRSFGKKGKNDGEFDDPYAVAVSPEGRVYVSDTNNDRIQVFK